MRARLTYLLLSPRGPQRGAGLLVGLVLSVAAVMLLVVIGYAGPMVTHAAAAAVVAL